MTSRRHSFRVLAAALTAFVAGGCYSYRPATPAALVPEAEVRVTLTPEETLRQQQTLGVLKQQLEGRVVEGVGSDMLGLVVPQPTASPGSPRGLNALVTIPQANIVQVETKSFSFAKTGLLAVAGAGVVIAVLAIADAATGGNDDGGPPDNARIAIPFRAIFR